MPKSTAKLAVPPKPYPEFPLGCHPSGKFQKSVLMPDGSRKVVYFGAWARREGKRLVPVANGGWEQALNEYETWKAGHDQLMKSAELARTKAQLKSEIEEAKQVAELEEEVAQLQSEADVNSMKVAKLCNLFLDFKRRKVKSKELGYTSYDEYEQAAKFLVEKLGARKPINELRPTDFEDLREAMLKRWPSPSRIKKFISMTRTIFKYGYGAELIEQVPNYGIGFVPLSKLRAKKYKNEGGVKLFTHAEVNRLLDAAKKGYKRTHKSGRQTMSEPSPALLAMIYLGLNAGFGNTDVASLTLEHLDFDAKIVTLPRSKTGVERECPLWPETIAAIQFALNKRPKTKLPNVFITRHGNPWIQFATEDSDTVDSIAKQFRCLLKGLGINGRRNLGYYSLRHTFTTIGMEVGDRDAVKGLLGHTDPEMVATYNHGQVPLKRRQAVVNYVRQWLLKGQGTPKKPK